jgi:hypothetical protein
MFRDTYCDALQDAAAPLAQKAVEGFKVCLDKAHGLRLSGPLVERCEAGLQALGQPLPISAPSAPPAPEPTGSLSPELIRDVVRSHLDDVRACADFSGLSSRAPSGRVVVKWKISASGAVTSPSLESSTFKDPATEQCILTTLKAWTFPKPQGGIVITHYPFELRKRREETTPLYDTVEVRGSLSKDLIRYDIRAHIGEVKDCYEKGARTKNLSGRLTVQFLIAGSGEVAAARALSSTLNDAETQQCIVEALKTWTFHRPQRGVVVVSYPFVLKAAPN